MCFQTWPQLTRGLTQEYDAAGNLTAMRRSQTGGTTSIMMTAEYRNAVRPTKRTVNTSCTALPTPCSSAAIVRNYGYDPTTGQLNEMEVVTNGTAVAGTHVNYQNTLQAHDLQLLGISAGTRSDHFAYDDRGRLRASVFGSKDATANPAAGLPGATTVGLTPADFLTAHLRTPLFDATTRGVLQSRGVSAEEIDPPSATFVEQPMAAHNTASVTQNGVTRSILYDNNGGQVSDDGRLVYSWDPRGLLVSATEKPTAGGTTIRRALYYYDGNHRMVGRRMEMALVFAPTAPLSTLDWQLENRPNILQLDNLPPEVTFVWDPVSDNLVTVVAVGAPSTDANAGVLKQIIHGGAGYDDPIEETSTIVTGSTTTLQRLYPTYDEAGAGTLQSVLNANGELAGRNVPNAIYTAQQLHLAGPAVEEVTLEAARDKNGALTSIDITLHATEQLTPATVPTGLRLATVDSSGAVVRTATTPAALVPTDPYAAHITLTAEEWTTLTDPAATSAAGLTAQALSVAATNTLRAKAWPAQTPFLPAPEWARASLPLFATSTLPVEVRESLPSLADWLKTVPNNTTSSRPLYKVTTLALLAQPSVATATPIASLLGARFQAQPFADSFTGKNYVRDRWYDPQRGSWLSPDAMRYQDSANLYSFCAGDPINCRDPKGTETLTPDERRAIQKSNAKEMEACRRDPASPTCVGIIGTLFGDDQAESIRVNGKKYLGKSPIVYINGVWNKRNGVIGSGAMLADYYQATVDVLWNPEQGKILDLLQTLLVDKTNTPDASTRNVVLYLRARVSGLQAGESIKVVAHSQGAAIFSSAASFLTAEERSRIELTTYGGASWTFPTGLKSVRNVVNVTDLLVPMLFGKGLEFQKNNEYAVFLDPLAINHPIKDYIDDEKYQTWLNGPAGAASRRQIEEKRKRWIDSNWEKR